MPVGIATPPVTCVAVTSIGRSSNCPDCTAALVTSPARSGVIERTASAGTDDTGSVWLLSRPSRSAWLAEVPEGIALSATITLTAFKPATARVLAWWT